MYRFRKAAVNDIDLLVESRIHLLRSAIGEGDPARWDTVKEQVEKYYRESLPQETHIAYLAFCGTDFVGTGGVCFYQILPTYYKPTGKKAYIINMYTAPDYRRRGIAAQILNLLVKESLERGATYISLEATRMGRPLYEKCGFAALHSEMQYVNEAYDVNNESSI